MWSGRGARLGAGRATDLVRVDLEGPEIEVDWPEEL